MRFRGNPLVERGLSWWLSQSRAELGMKKIFVLGFGRSGTTWISDVISKVTGQLILFEPFHPSVTEFSREFSYASISNDNSSLLWTYLQDVMEKKHRKMWLMRNHIPVTLDVVSGSFLNEIWERCDVIGFKEVRANFMISWLCQYFDCKVVYIVRHPCAVVSSILKRTNFWEFGWPETYIEFLNKSLYSHDAKVADSSIPQSYYYIINSAESYIDKIAVMWSITHLLAYKQIKQLGLPLFFYEDFYAHPFQFVNHLLEYLELGNRNIHPAYIFTPSMTTLKTLHGLYEKETDIERMGAAIFWDKILSDGQVEQIMNIVEGFGIHIYDKSGFPC
jgi:hypothetical protein